MKDLVTFLAKSITKKPDSVTVNDKEVKGVTVIELKVSPDDRGRIIGKNGKTIKAIRCLLNASSSLSKKKVSLEIVE